MAPNNDRFNHWEAPLLKQYAYINQLPRWLTHGDLHGKNIGAPNLVIDWDKCGALPMGFDIALSISKTQRLDSVKQLIQLLE